MRRLLVTGGAGFIGSNFVRYWNEQHGADRIVVLDALTYAGNVASLDRIANPRQLRFVQGDICDGGLVESLLRDEALDAIVHFAAESHVDRSIRGPDEFIRTNVVGTHCLLKAARQVWMTDGKAPQHRFHHVSTDEVYGSLGPQDPAFSETTSYAPNSPYSASKAASDHLVRAYHHTYGLNVTISNCSNNYGPYHFPEKLIPLTIVNILEGKPLPVYGDGRNIRDWLHVGDHCRAIEAVLDRGKVGEVYNVGGNSERENIEIVRTLCRLAEEIFAARPELAARFPQSPAVRGEAASLIRFVTDRPGHDRRYAICADKAARELGFTPRMSLTDGLRATLLWFLENEQWWRQVTSGEYRNWTAAHYGIR